MQNRSPERFRPNVGALLRNHDNHILMAERLNQPDNWQFPQGGVDRGETLEEALWRELSEELGMPSPRVLCRLVAQAQPVRYRFPENLRSRISRKYVGQEQSLFLLDFLGKTSDFQLDASEHPEFRAVRWVPLEEARELLWEVKRPVLDAALATWTDHLARGWRP